MSIVLFLGVLFILVLVHEWGHFIVAKKTGMKVEEFGIGFPPRLFGIKRGGTEYTFNALPIGGFVRIFGENALDADESDSKKGSFMAASKLSQVAVLVAGVLMNILFAWLLFVVSFMVGVTQVVEEGTQSGNAELTVHTVLQDSPAAEAGIAPGAVITEVRTSDDELDSLTPSTFSSFVKGNADTAIRVTYLLSEQTETTEITPETGVLEEGATPAVGIGLALTETVQRGPLEAVAAASSETTRLLSAITLGIISLASDSISGEADYSEVAGPVGIVSLVEEAASFGLVALLMFTAVISLNLAVINLLPFPALDGGRLVIVAVEAVLRRPINPLWVARINAFGFMLLMLLMVLITYNDIINR